MTRFWNWIDQQTEDGQPERVLEINGTIAEESWFDDEITPEMFKSELNSGEGDIVVYINSPGGDCIAASRIYTMLMEYKGSVTVKVDGLAASAASVIAMAGSSVLMAPTAMMMIHNPATLAWGDHNDMEKAIEVLDEVKESIINAYTKKTSLSRAKLARMMEDETWMNARKAIELGFADGMIGDDGDGVVAYAFSASAVARNFTNKVAAKAETPAEAENTDGAKVSDLRKALYDKSILI
ncbi:MAG: Clp protease ClpP [Lachnospiraceae bacterium]|nr:Clp protease ClpP [Lachnospiraceae bacterium]